MAVQFDASSVQQRIMDRLKSKVAWSDVLYFSTNSRVLDTVAEEIAYFASYSDYNTRETKWSLARNRSSLVAQTSLHRYDVHRAISSTGLLRVSLDKDLAPSPTWDNTTTFLVDDYVAYSNKFYKALTTNIDKQPDTNPSDWVREDVSHAETIGIPIYSNFSDGDVLKFTTIKPFNLVVGDDYVDVEIIQGVPREFLDTSTGIENEEFEINETTIENTYIITSINDVEWTEVVESLLLEDKDSETYEIENQIDFSGVLVKFGNNLFGKKLESGDALKVEYLETLGGDGNVVSKDIINSVDSTFTDLSLNEVDLFCSNFEEVIGGQNIEDKESIRVNAPNTFQTGDRASTAIDYETIISNNYSYVEKIVVWGAYETNIDQGLSPWTYIPLEENKVNISALTTALTDLNDNQKNEISEGINQYKAPTDILNYVEPQVCNVVFDIQAYVSDTSYLLADVKGNIDTGLYDKYSAFNREFFQHIRFSDYQSYIDSIAGVDYHDTSISFFTLLAFEGAYDKVTTLPLFNSTPTTVKIYLTDIENSGTEFLVATDNGSGTFVAEPDLLVVGSTINYSTGDLTIDIQDDGYGLGPETDYQIRVAYDIDDKDNVLTGRNQIFNYSSDYTTINTQYTL